VKFVRANSGPQISCAPILVGSCSFQKLKKNTKKKKLEIWPEFGHIPRAYFKFKVQSSKFEIHLPHIEIHGQILSTIPTKPHGESHTDDEPLVFVVEQ
jgi:hypothetical protein